MGASGNEVLLGRTTLALPCYCSNLRTVQGSVNEKESN